MTQIIKYILISTLASAIIVNLGVDYRQCIVTVVLALAVNGIGNLR